MRKMTNFQIVILGIFVFFILVGVVLFAGFGKKDPTVVGEVFIWGSMDSSIMEEMLERSVNENYDYLVGPNQEHLRSPQTNRRRHPHREAFWIRYNYSI